jgi:predicted XRE-type DNA-binding protein
MRPLSQSSSEAALPISNPPISELIRGDVAIFDEIGVKKYGRHTIIAKRFFLALQ